MEREKLAFLVKEIAMSLYTDLSETDKVYLGKDLNSIINSNPIETLKNLNELLENLVDCKKSMKEVDFFDEFSENQGYQKALQKLDRQIRTHIKYELQMKVCVDSLEETLLISQTQGSISLDSKKKLLEKVKEENKNLKAKLTAKNKEITELNSENSLINAKEIFKNGYLILLKKINLKLFKNPINNKRQKMKIKYNHRNRRMMMINRNNRKI